MKKVVSLLCFILIFTSCSKLADGLGDLTGVNDEGKVGTSNNKDTGVGNNNSGGNNSGGSNLGDYLANVLVDHAKAESMTFSRDCAAGFTKYVMVDGDKGNYYFCMTTEPVVTQSFTDSFNILKNAYSKRAENLNDPLIYTNFITDLPNSQALLDLIKVEINPSEIGTDGYFFFSENYCLKRSARVCREAEMDIANIHDHFEPNENVTSGEGWPNMSVNRFIRYNEDPFLVIKVQYWRSFEEQSFDVATDFNTYCCYH